MSARLEDAIRAARAGEVAWDEARASRVRAGVVRKQRTHRALRRGAFVATGAGLLVLALLRLAPASPSNHEGREVAAASEPAPEPVAALASGDAGYSRD